MKFTIEVTNRPWIKEEYEISNPENSKYVHDLIRHLAKLEKVDTK